MAPANGCPRPHSRFWIASAGANTSRPQPFACDSGVRKNPRDDRGPKVRTEIVHPHNTITIGVRQLKDLAADAVMLVMIAPGSRTLVIHLAPPNGAIVRAYIR